MEGAMALTQYNTYLQTYIQAAFDNHALFNGSFPIINFNPNWTAPAGNTTNYKVLVPDTNTWDVPYANTDAGLSALVSSAGIAPVARRMRYVKLADFEADRDGALGVLEQAASIIVDNYAYNVETLLLNSITPATMSGALSATHLNDEKANSFSWTGVMKAVYASKNPTNMRYVFVHPTVLASSNLYATLDTPSSTITGPIRAANLNVVGEKNGMVIISSDRVNLQGNVYESVILGDNAFSVQYQRNFATNIFYDPRYEGGSWVVSYHVGIAPAINGISYAGAAGTDLAGVADATMEAQASWARIANMRDNQYPIAVLRSLV
jgi:hypothetical protein